MKQYIVESALKAQTGRKQYTLYDSILVYVENPLPKEVSVQNVLNKLKNSIPKHVLRDLETIYIGDFKNLVYGEFPKQEDILETLKLIQERLKTISWNIKV
jgi:hypothetical protein